jgi:uncharacterized protein
MSQSDDLDLVRGAYDAFARGDIQAVLAVCAEDIEWNVPDVLPHGMHVRGHEAVGRFFGTLAGRWSDFGLELYEIVPGERASVITRGVASGALDGQRTSYGFVHAFTIRDGKAVAFEEYVAPPQGGFPTT